MYSNYLASALKQFKYYEQLGSKTMAQLSDEQLLIEPQNGINSIAVIVKHLHGNMRSRWTDFLTTDGEKDFRNRDQEFEATLNTRHEIESTWKQGWQIVFDALEPLQEDDFQQLVYIRNQGHTVIEAINRQLCHYSYHVGQMVYIGKWLRADDWQSLSIARNKSKSYNAGRFSKEKSRGHFTDDM